MSDVKPLASIPEHVFYHGSHLGERSVRMPYRWKQLLKIEREQRETYFAIHPQSPIPREDRDEFTGLDYYPPNQEYRFELAFHEHPQKKRVEMAYTKGETKEFLRWGEFRFLKGDKEQMLQAYKTSADDPFFFVPFRDATNGTETYGAGRYIDLKPEQHQTDELTWVLDFNRAYNPLCAYNPAYTCPFVPPENWLKIPIPVGEKKYKPIHARAKI
jgi:uncharacterized protein (DUF1684 family)